MAEKRPSELLDPLDAHRRLTTKEVMALIGVKSKNTLWKRVREGKVPRPQVPGAAAAAVGSGGGRGRAGCGGTTG